MKRFFASNIRCSALLLIVAQVCHADEYDKIARSVIKAAGQFKVKKIAVLPFSHLGRKESSASIFVSERLTTLIAGKEGIEVVERRLIERIVAEMKLRAATSIDSDAAHKLGAALSAEAVVTGTIINQAKNRAQVNARLVAIANGSILAAASVSVERQWQETASVVKPNANDDVSFMEEWIREPIFNPSAELFQRKCTGCHGADAQGGSLRSVGSDLQNLDLTDLRVVGKSDQELAGHIAQGGEKMPPCGNLPGFYDRLSTFEVRELVLYLKQLSVKQQSADNVPEPLKLSEGAKIFQNSCFLCHGPTGKGSAYVAKMLDVDKNALDLTKKTSDMSEEHIMTILQKGERGMPSPGIKPSKKNVKQLLHYLHCVVLDKPQSDDCRQ
ncbi:MAG: FlgO family outer membrane protein [Elusimicrobiota bacterium]